MDVHSTAGAKRSRKALLAITLLTALVGVVAVGPAAAQPKPLVVTFEKHVVDPTNLVFQGTTGGRAKGALESRMVPGSLTIDGAVWRFAFDWIVDATAEHKSFVARTTGTFDTSTGRVVMDGVVTEGWYEGAPVHEEGRLLDPATLTFAGELQISRDDDQPAAEVPTFMVERYLPGVAAAAFAQSVRRAAAAAAAMSEEGESIRYLGSVFLPGEECSFCCFEAARAESVSEANRRAGVPYWRVVEAIVIER